MGSSAKKKKAKSDFNKTKLKVGKEKAKNANATSTSFTARSIVIKQQSLSENNRDGRATFNYQLSLLSSRNEVQRRDALAYLTSYVLAHPSDLPQSPSTILAKAMPLVLDGNSAIRSQLLKLARGLSSSDLGPLDSPLLYIRAGMTHLSVDIRLQALDLLDWLVTARGSELVSLSGGWIKMLQTFQILLGWQTTGVAPSKWSEAKSTTTTMGNSKLVVHQLNTLAALLNAGLQTEEQSISYVSTFPYWHRSAHALPSRRSAYSHLNLFGQPHDIQSEMYESAVERREALLESGLREAFVRGSDDAKQVGGEVGRAAAGVIKLLRQASQD